MSAFPIRKSYIFTFLALVLGGMTSIRAEEQDTLNKKNNLVYAGFLQGGRVKSNNPFLLRNPDDKELGEFTALSFQLLRQTTGKSCWEQYYRYPRYGLGVIVSRFFHNEYLCTPITIYSVFQAPLIQWKKLSLNYETGIGLTFNWKSYNPAEGNYNISLGAPLTSYIDGAISLRYELTPHFDLGIGYSFTHFSNGAMKIPNFGINIYSPRISINYQINRFEPPLKKPVIPPLIKNTTLDISIYGGEKNVIYPECNVDTATEFNGIYYPEFGISTIIYRQLNYKLKVGIGMTLGYDGSKNSIVTLKNGRPDPDQSLRKENITFCIFPSFDLDFDKISAYAQPSFYLIKNETTYPRPDFFIRVGINYKLSEHLYIGPGLRSYRFHNADFIEWTVGYKMPL